jgi:hypothetical protein
MGSTVNSHKQVGAGSQKQNQPETHGGQRMQDQEKPVPSKGAPDGGADRGPRAAR